MATSKKTTDSFPTSAVYERVIREVLALGEDEAKTILTAIQSGLGKIPGENQKSFRLAKGKILKEKEEKKMKKIETKKIEVAEKALVRGRENRVMGLVGHYTFPHCDEARMCYEVIAPHDADPQLLWIYGLKVCSKEEHESNPLSREGINCFLKPVRLLVKKVDTRWSKEEEGEGEIKMIPLYVPPIKHEVDRYSHSMEEALVEEVGEPIDITPADLKITGYAVVEPEGVIKIELLNGELRVFSYAEAYKGNKNLDDTKIDNVYAAIHSVGGSAIDYQLLRGKLGQDIQVPTTIGWEAPQKGNSYIASQPGMYIIGLRGKRFTVNPSLVNGGIRYNKDFNNLAEYRQVVELGRAPFATTPWKILKAEGHVIDKNGNYLPLSHATLVKPDGDAIHCSTAVSCCMYSMPVEQQILFAKFNVALMLLLAEEQREMTDEIACALLFGECIDWRCTARYHNGMLECGQLKYDIDNNMETLIDEMRKVFVSQEPCLAGQEAFVARISRL